MTGQVSEQNNASRTRLMHKLLILIGPFSRNGISTLLFQTELSFVTKIFCDQDMSAFV